MRSLPSRLLSKVVIVEVLRSMGHRAIADGAKATSLFVEVGKAIESEWRAHLLDEIPSLKWRMISAIRKARESFGGARGDYLAVRRLWRQSSKAIANDRQVAEVSDWSLAQKGRIGALAVKCLLETAKIVRVHRTQDGIIQCASMLDADRGELTEQRCSKEVQPAFYSSFQYLEGHRIGVVKINDEVAARLDRDPANITLHPRYLPMLAPPLPWTEPSNGAYLIHGGPSFSRVLLAARTLRKALQHRACALRTRSSSCSMFRKLTSRVPWNRSTEL